MVKRFGDTLKDDLLALLHKQLMGDHVCCI